ncbi:MAG: peptide deformylase [Candidatus Pacebacteria bacterium CG_4_10_14_0_8_um_filter_42_14]|nr:MAG: peptide deformylase [Candidatus Pacebacteria bacterium CG_4_10_14_0_8_um_filter_42_14]
MRSKYITEIITVPHETLRKKAAEITLVDAKTIQLVRSLEATLAATKNPKGVGLAATQINTTKRAFSTQRSNSLTTYINPVITSHSDNLVLGPTDDEPRFEGCLSIPAVYGPVPRWQWVEVEFQTLDGKKLRRASNRLVGFDARVIQHELDHLDGILFIDYSLTYDLPIYTENEETEEFDPIDKSVLLALGAQKLTR